MTWGQWVFLVILMVGLLLLFAVSWGNSDLNREALEREIKRNKEAE